MACDICGSNDSQLSDLLKDYQTERIKQICPACEKTVNDQLWKIREMQHKMLESLLQRFMRMLRERFNKGEKK